MIEAQLLYKTEEHSIETVVSLLQDDQLVILPCDTIYGISAKVGESTLFALRDLKQTIQQQKFAILATLEQAQKICDVPSILLEHWPCPLTVILNNTDGCGSSAVRVPKDPFITEILTRLGSPIFSTAVNGSGFTITNITDIIFTFKDKVPAIVIDPSRQRDTPSTMLDMTKKPATLLRCGDYDASAILSDY